MAEAEETSTTSLSLSASATTSPRAGKGLFQFEHTPPSDAAYQQQNLNLRSIKDNERRYALEQLQQCDNLREGTPLDPPGLAHSLTRLSPNHP
jgi:hypothetical protein